MAEFTQSQGSGLGPGAKQYTQEHEDWVYAISWSSQRSNRIASASRDGEIKVWDAFTGKNLVIYREHRACVNCVAWSPDDEYIASAGEDGTVRVHRVALSAEIDGFQKRGRPVRSVAWLQGRNVLASGGADSRVHRIVPSVP
jgi:WD40 repeat protein